MSKLQNSTTDFSLASLATILPAGEWTNVGAENLLILHLSNLRRDVIISTGLALI